MMHASLVFGNVHNKSHGWQNNICVKSKTIVFCLPKIRSNYLATNFWKPDFYESQSDFLLASNAREGLEGEGAPNFILLISNLKSGN